MLQPDGVPGSVAEAVTVTQKISRLPAVRLSLAPKATVLSADPAVV
jgi:hypothetical protein